MATYLQHVQDSTISRDVRMPELKIQKNDLLSIQLYSASTKQEISDAPFNLPPSTSGAAGTQAASGYLVDVNGNIEYPRIGLIHAEGLTKLELADIVKRRINEKDSVLTNPSVIVRFQNLKITLLGEVNTQGTISMPGEKVTIVQALGLAGGITDWGLKDKVRVVREVDGKRQMGWVDLSSDTLFRSPYYDLVQNDVIIVEATKRKAKKADTDIAIQRIGFALSLITAITLLYTIFQ